MGNHQETGAMTVLMFLFVTVSHRPVEWTDVSATHKLDIILSDSEL